MREVMGMKKQKENRIDVVKVPVGTKVDFFGVFYQPGSRGMRCMICLGRVDANTTKLVNHTLTHCRAKDGSRLLPMKIKAINIDINKIAKQAEERRIRLFRRENA